jgi:hypothetical protein
MKYSFTIDTPSEEILDAALKRVKTRRELVDALGCDTRLLREYAACALCAVAQVDAKLLLDFEAEIIDALDRPESLTRYTIIEVIGALTREKPKIVLSAYEPLQDCLYDEDSGTVRLYTFRVLAAYGATGTARSQKVWPDLSMAIRCYHGDPEFIAMVNELIAMLSAKADISVKEAAAELFAFDADNARGTLKRKAQAVTAFAPQVIERLHREAKRKADAAQAAKEAEARAAARAAAAAADDSSDDDN